MAAVAGVVLGFIAYVGLASGSPGAALITTSLLVFAAALFATLIAWPMELKITWQRQLELLGYRTLAALAAYAVLGLTILFSINTLTDRVVPIDEQGHLFRRLPFWPFYALAVLSCRSPLPAPPGAC